MVGFSHDSLPTHTSHNVQPTTDNQQRTTNNASLVRPADEEEVREAAGIPPMGAADALGMLRSALAEAASGSWRPCGYVFKEGDIGYNCRTCQADPTCVLCADCFRASDHEGHDISFHRTSPGGCCDCGDVEAWKPEGMCDKHRPPPSLCVPCGVEEGEGGGGGGSRVERSAMEVEWREEEEARG